MVVDRARPESRPTLDELSGWLRRWFDRAYCRIVVFDQRTDRCTIAAAAPAPRQDGFPWEQDVPLAANLASLPPQLDKLKFLILDQNALRNGSSLTLPCPLTELLLVPITASGRLVGLLEFGECREREGGAATRNSEDRRLKAVPSGRDGLNLAELAARAAPLVLQVLESERKRRLLEHMESMLRELHVTSSASWREISALAAELLNAGIGAAYVRHGSADELVLEASPGSEALARSLNKRCRRGEGFIGSLAAPEPPGTVDANRLARSWPEHGGPSPFRDDAITAALAVPVRGEGVDAVLLVADDTPRRSFDAVDRDVIERFARHAAAARRREHLTPQAKQLAQFKILHQISDYTQRTEDLDQVLHAVLTGVTAGYGLRFNRAALFLLDDARTTLEGKMAIGHLTREEALLDWQYDRQRGPQDFTQYLELVRHAPARPTPLHRAVLELSLQLDGDGDALRKALDAPSRMLAGPEICGLPEQLQRRFDLDIEPRSQILFVRLMTMRPLGLIVVDNRFTRDPITREAIESMLTFASTATVAIESFQARNDSKLVDDAARAVTEPHDGDDEAAVTARLVATARDLCKASNAVFWAYNRDSRQFAPQPVSANRDAAAGTELAQHEAHMLRTTWRILDDHYLRVDSVRDAPVLDDPQRAFLIGRGVHSFQGIVLQVGNEPLGVIYVHYAQPRDFEDADRQRLTRFAMQVALALKTARLVRRIELDQRTETVLEKLAPLPYLENTLEVVAQQMKDVVGCDLVTLHAYNATIDAFERPRYAGALVNRAAADRDLDDDSSLVRWVMAQTEPVQVEDFAQHEAFRRTRFADVENIHSCLAFSLRAFGPPIGALFANYHDKRRFTPDQVAQGIKFAHQAAIGIANALMLRDYEDQASVPRALLETQTLGETLSVVAELTATRLGRKGASPVMSQVVLKEADDGRGTYDLVVRAVHGGDQGLIGTTYPRDSRSQTRYTAEDAKEVVVATYDRRETRFPTRDEEQRGFQSGMSARMFAGGDLVGVLEVRSGRRREFGELQQHTLSFIAAQAAMAIKSDQHSARERRRHGYLRAIQEAEKSAERVRRGKLTRKDALADLLRITVKCFRTHSLDPRTTTFGTLLLFRPPDILVLEAVYPLGLRKQFEQVVGPERSLRVGQVGITGTTVLTGKSQLELDLPRGKSQHLPVVATTRSEIAAPIISCERVVGVLDVESESPRGFDRSDLETLETLAGLVAVALANHGIEHIARAAHDLRNSMTLSVPRMGRILHSARTRDASALVGRLKYHVEEASFQYRLTQDIMAAALVLNEAPLKLRRTSLARLVQSVVDSVRDVAERKDLHVTLPVGDPVKLWIDKDRMRQVVMNLIANAIKFTGPYGRIDVLVSAETEQVRVEVTDDGPHQLSADDLERLFEPYYQALAVAATGAPGSPKRQGQGLGLSIAKTFVELHGGHIWARSNQPAGLTVAFELPARKGGIRP
jgi:signal transduction histidine kinase